MSSTDITTANPKVQHSFKLDLGVLNLKMVFVRN